MRASGSRRPGRKPAPRGPAQRLSLTVERLASEGHGFARIEGRPVLIPGALAGETVTVDWQAGAAQARLAGIENPSADRVQPACAHFGVCGGCVLQHLGESAYAPFKERLVRDALARHGLGGVEILPVQVSPPRSRRRATLEARRRGQGKGEALVLGFHAEASRDLVDIAGCAILTPMLEALLPSLHALLLRVLPPGGTARAVLTELREGVDLGLELPALPGLAELEAFAAFAPPVPLARLWWRVGEDAPVLAAQAQAPSIAFGGLAVTPVMGGFLQATEAGEATLAAVVCAGLRGAGRIADLHAGCGTFALRLAAGGAAVHAVELSGEALGALAAAARRHGLLQVSTERRDLDARPLVPAELDNYDAVVFDPPRAGARALTVQLAASRVPRIAAVSCNPASFARDARILVDGGYRLEAVQPVDQFLWSAHIELAAIFRR